MRTAKHEQGAVISAKGFEGFRGKNGKVYRTKKAAEFYGGGIDVYG